MKLFPPIILLFFCTLSFAQNDADFNEAGFLRDIDSEAQTLIDDNELDLEFNDDLNEIAYKKAPKLNPRTQIVTTKNGKFIYHPNQEKGLYKITRDNKYHYKYKKSALDGFIHVKGGSLNLENLTSSTDKSITFETIYDSSSVTTIYLEYEWQPLKKYRAISLKAGGGLSYARGKGRFVGAGNVNAGKTAQESYTFLMLPLSAGLIYKFQLTKDQLFLPFATGGLDYNLITEFRSGFEAFKYSGVFSGHFGGGVLLNLGWLEKSAALELDKEFGINNTYLSLEARTIVSFEKKQDIGGVLFLAGLSFEY